MRSYGAINLITMFWYTTRKWEAIKCIIPAWIRRFWMTLHVFQRVNYIWGPNVIALASAIAQAPITPLPKNHSKKHSLQQTLDDSIITSWLLLPTILIITQTTHLYHFSVLIGKLQPKEIWWVHLNLEVTTRQQLECKVVVRERLFFFVVVVVPLNLLESHPMMCFSLEKYLGIAKHTYTFWIVLLFHWTVRSHWYFTISLMSAQSNIIFKIMSRTIGLAPLKLQKLGIPRISSKWKICFSLLLVLYISLISHHLYS